MMRRIKYIAGYIMEIHDHIFTTLDINIPFTISFDKPNANLVRDKTILVHKDFGLYAQQIGPCWAFFVNV